MSDFLAVFHFLRPYWLLALLPALVLWLRLWRGRDPRVGLADDIAPHLLKELVSQPADRPRLRPDTLVLPLWAVMVIALAGPAFRRQPSPFSENQSQLLIVMKMTESLENTDVQPSRLERSRTKLHDLLELRKGSGNALIAYSGTAHLVMPPTRDGQVIEHMLEALSPEIMPNAGDDLPAALDVATQLLRDKDIPGSILLVADSIASANATGLREWRASHSESVQILVPLRDKAVLAQSGIPEAADTLSAKVYPIAPDSSDVEQIARRADQALVSAASDDATAWRDDGYLLIPVVALGLLFWSRRGWSIGRA